VQEYPIKVITALYKYQVFNTLRKSMKKKGFTFLAALLIAVSIFGQSPDKISYQAVVRDATNATVANQVVGMQISILQDGTLENPGSAVYVETQTPTTNANGLLSIYIGAGTAVTGTFGGIAWSDVPHYIKIEIDPSGNNTNYTITGTTQLVSVPFALYAKTAGSSLMPTMTNAERLAISDPATAFMVYVTDFDGGTVMLYDGSKWKELSLIQLRTLPDAPTDVTATATNGEATVSFTAPSNNGGSPITKYTATSNPGNITGTLNPAEGGTITVTDLANGTAYTFTVTATNAIGTSAASAASNSVIPAPQQVGDFNQGGVVFYLFVDGETGYVEGESHGLIAAVEDQSTGIQWYNGSYIVTGATATGIGTGAANTTAIIAAQGATETNYAAGLARAYTGGGFTDWFLPSKDELNLMYINKAAINTTITANGGAIFTTNFYWSSTEYNFGNAWRQDFDNGGQNDDTKNDTYDVRAVRAF
jgi:hypothetical protein